MQSVSPTKAGQPEFQRMQLEMEAKVQELKAQHMQQLQKQGAVAPNAVAPVPVDPKLEKLKQDLRSAEHDAVNLQGSYVVLKQVQSKTQHDVAVARKRIQELEKELAAAQDNKEPVPCGDCGQLQQLVALSESLTERQREKLTLQQEHIESLQKHIEKLQELQNPTACGDCGQLSQQLTLMESEVERERQQRSATEQVAAGLQRALESLQEELQRLKDSAAGGDASALRQSEGALRKELQEKETEIEGERHRHDEQLKKLQAKKERYHHQSKTSHSAVTRLQQELDALQIELTATNEAAEEEMNSLRKTEAGLRTELKDAKTTYDEELSRQTQIVLALKEQLVHERQQATAERKTVAELQKQVDTLQGEMKKMTGNASEDLDSLRQLEAALRNELQAVKIANEATKKDCLEFQTRCQEYEQKYEQLLATTKQKEANSSSNTDELRRLRAELADLQRSSGQAEAQLLQEATDTNLLREQLDEARASGTKSTKKLEKLRKRTHTEASAKDQELHALAKEKQAVEREKRQLQTELEELQKRMQNEEPPKVSELMVLKTAKQALEKEKQRLAKELDKLRQSTQHEAAASDQRIQELTGKKLQVEGEKQRLERELEKLRQQTENDQDEQLQAVVREKQEVEREKRRLEVENERLESERRFLQSEIALLKDEQLMGSVDDDEKPHENQKKLHETVEALTRENAELNERIDKLMDQLFDAPHTKQPGNTESGGDIPRFQSRDLERGSSPNEGNADWKNQLSKPKENEVTAAEKTSAMRAYGGRNILARGGDTITYLTSK